MMYDVHRTCIIQYLVIPSHHVKQESIPSIFRFVYGLKPFVMTALLRPVC